MNRRVSDLIAEAIRERDLDMEYLTDPTTKGITDLLREFLNLVDICMTTERLRPEEIEAVLRNLIHATLPLKAQVAERKRLTARLAEALRNAPLRVNLDMGDQ